jgi:hypothetical protein
LKIVFNTIAFAATLLASSSAMAVATTVIAADNFESGNAVGSSVIGSAGGTGWASAWASPTAASTIAAPIGMEGDKSLQISTNNTAIVSRALTTAISGDVLVRFEFQYSGILERNDFLGFWFGDSNGPNVGLKANCDAAGTACTNDVFVRTNTNTKMLPDSDLTAETTYVLFAHLYKTNGSTNYNNFDACLNPSNAEMATLINPDMVSSGVSSIASFSTIGFRSDNLNNGVVVRIDDVSIAAVPEPTTIALFGAALLGIGALRRRRA